MPYVRTQIYLDPDDHRRLSDEAHARGMSLTALIREIVSASTSGAPSRRPRDMSALIGCLDDEATDIRRDEARYREAALEKRLQKKLGREDGSAKRSR